MVKYPIVYIEQQETFPKQTFRNRATIATGNGSLTLTVPVVRPQGNHTRTEEIGISYKESWNVQHWRAIQSAYNASPYFLYYRDELEQILLRQHQRLIDLNDALLKYILKKSKIACDLKYTTDYTPSCNAQLDFRTTLTSKKAFCNAHIPEYSQVFEAKLGFIPNLSILDLLFNLGPETREYLIHLSQKVAN